MADEIDRYNICEDIAREWAKVPELRLGQLIANAIADAGGRGGQGDCDPFFVKDAEIVELVRNFVRKWR